MSREEDRQTAHCGRPSVGFYLRYLLHDSRGARGRMAFFAACLAVGVAAVVGVAALGEHVQEALRQEARRTLGGDLSVRSHQPLPAAAREILAQATGAARVHTVELLTMARASYDGGAGRSSLVELAAIDGPYPLYGDLQVSPVRPLKELLAHDGVVVAPELLHRLHLAVGDTLHLGEAAFTIRGTLLREPGQLISPIRLGPRVYLSMGGFSRTHLVRFGSRINYRELVRWPSQDRSTAATVLQRLESLSHREPGLRVTSADKERQNLGKGAERVERFLSLVALLSLLVGGVGVAQSIRAFLASRLDAVAILKCLGLRPRQAFALYVGQCVVLGTLGSIVGGLAGLATPLLLPLLLPGLSALPTGGFWQPLALLRGVALGVAVAALFGLPPLAQVLRVPPLRALRRSAEPLPPSRWGRILVASATFCGVFLLATAQAESWLRGAQFVLGLTLVVALLAVAALALRNLCRRLRHAPLPLWLRQGAALAGRPGGDLLAASVALGLGVLVVLTTVLVERQLSAALAADLPADAPNAFFLDVQPDQWPGVDALLRSAHATSISSVPVVMARLARIGDKTVQELAAERRQRGERSWALTREQRLTYLPELPSDNHLIAGSWWQPGKSHEVSLEEGYARDLGVGLGDHLTFDIQGVPVTLTVTSLRSVEWRSFHINFFLIVEPGALEAAPQSRLAAAALQKDAAQKLQDELAAQFPNVTLIDVRDVLLQVAGLLHRLGSGVRLIGAFTAVAGLAILFGAIAAGSLRRSRDTALLKTLGFTRAGVTAVFSTEHALTGAVAGIVGTAGGVVLAWVVIRQGMDLPWQPEPALLVASLFSAVLLAALAGLAASWRALRQPPAAVLREARE